MRTLSEGQSEIVDVVAVIDAFLADETQCQLQLPNLTAAQRKQAKTVVETHCELTCESFGFGTERQLHIFKNSSCAVPHLDEPGRDVLTEGSDGPPVSFVLESTASQLDESSLTEHGGEFHLAPIKERPCEAPELVRTASSDRSTTASTSSPVTEIRGCLSEQLRPSLPTGLQVRNTFIDVEDEHADDREVQSMPHGMFGHYLKTELNERQSAKSNMPSDSPAVVDASVLAPGTVVIINGLQKLPAFNGSTGAVQSFDQESGRYSILLATPTSGGHNCAKVKPEHVQVLSSASHPPGKHLSSPLDNHISGPHGTMGLQGFPSTPGWDDAVHGHHMFRRSAS